MGDEDTTDRFESGSEKRARFFKERRLLLIISLLLVAHLFFKLNIKDIEALGEHLDIDKPEHLWLIVWAVWAWTLFSSLTQWYSLRPYARFPEDRYQATRTALFRWWVASRMKVAIHASFSRQVATQNQRAVLIGEPESAIREQRRYFMSNVTLAWKGEPDDPADAELLDEAATGPDWYVNATGSGRDRHGTKTISGSVGIPEEYESDRVRRLARLWTWLATSYFLDYLAPVLLGFVPLLLFVWRWLHSSASA